MASPTGGYVSTYKPPKPPRVRTGSLALAAAGGGGTSPSNPFGFQVAKNTTGFREPAAAPLPRVPAVRPTAAATPTARLPLPQAQGAAPATPAPGGYDLNTDPALQQISALTGLNDEQANAAALKQRQQLLLGYGDPNLIRQTLGDENLASAAAGSPTSTIASLGQQRERNQKSFTDALVPQNLLYSGYRVTQEEQAAQDFQNALAQAAAGVNTGLDTISGNLSGALASNQHTRITAEQEARDRAIQAAITAGTAGGTGAAGAAGGLAGAAAGDLGSPANPVTHISHVLPTQPPAPAAPTPLAGMRATPLPAAKTPAGVGPLNPVVVDALVRMLSSAAPKRPVNGQLARNSF